MERRAGRRRRVVGVSIAWVLVLVGASLPAAAQEAPDQAEPAVSADELRAASDALGEGGALAAVREYDRGLSLTQVSQEVAGGTLPVGDQAPSSGLQPFRPPSGAADEASDAKLEKAMDRQAKQLRRAGTVAPRESLGGDYGLLVVLLGLMQSGYSPEQIIVDLLLDTDNQLGLLPTPFLSAGEESPLIPVAIVRKKDGKLIPPDPPARPDGEAAAFDALFDDVFGSTKTKATTVEIPANTNLEYRGFGRLSTFVNTDTPVRCTDDAAKFVVTVTYTGELSGQVTGTAADLNGQCSNFLGRSGQPRVPNGAAFYAKGPAPAKCAARPDEPTVCSYKVTDVPGAVVAFDGKRMVAKYTDTASGFRQYGVEFWIPRV